MVILLLCAFSLGVFANPSTDFLEKAYAIDGEGSFAERYAALLLAQEAYEALDEAQKQSVSEAYAQVMAEREELAALAVKAEAFIARAASLADCTSIMDKVRIFDEAYAPDRYFGDESYPGIKAAKEEFEKIKKKRDDTVSFIILVDELLTEREGFAYVAENYFAIKELLDKASALYPLIDMGYSGATGAAADYGAINAEVIGAEQHTEGVIELIEVINAKTDYASKKSLVASLERDINSEDFIIEYEGAEASIAALAVIKDYFSECEAQAQNYIVAVEAIGGAESRFAAICAAISIRASVDGTVGGVSSTDGTLEAIVKDYNSFVALANAALLGISAD